MPTPPTRALASAALVAALLAAGCGGDRQDANEPGGHFRVRVTGASFPAQQAIAQRARMRIAVRNADQRTVPNVAVTVETRPAHAGTAPVAFGQIDTDPRLADGERPVWVLDDGPKGGSTAQTNTWALGALAPGETKTFRWKLTAVRPGTYTVAYRVSPGLYGKAEAAGGEKVEGAFKVTISDAPVPAHVGGDGQVVRGEEAGSSGT